MKRQTYFDDERHRHEELRRIVAASEALRYAMSRADEGEDIRVRVLCPKRHFLRDLQLSTYHSDGHDYPLLEVVGNAAAASVITDATPGGALSVCDHGGCPKLIPHAATVCDAGHVQGEYASGLRVGFTCRKCAYSDPKRQETLVKLFALALHVESRELRLT